MSEKPAGANGSWDAWQQKQHAQLFDARASMPIAELRRAYEQFNEFQLFLDQKDKLEGRDFVEIGCATGELYRYLRRYHPEIRYTGFDVSKPAIERAREKYPEGRFFLTTPDLENVRKEVPRPAVLWCRDVLQHQPDPYGFLRRILALGQETTILRARTRDRGASVIDAERSCQWHYDHWVPYIVLNTEELVDKVQGLAALREVHLVKRFVVLGGWHGRFLPKDCYDPRTGTAETALMLVHGNADKARVTVSQREDTELPKRLWRIGFDFVRRTLYTGVRRK